MWDVLGGRGVDVGRVGSRGRKHLSFFYLEDRAGRGEETLERGGVIDGDECHAQRFASDPADQVAVVSR